MPLFHKEYLEISIKKTKEFFAQYGVMLCLNEVYKQKEFTHLIKKSTKVNFYNQYERACLSTDMDFKNYWESALLKKKRKELNRLFNRLSDTGNITFHKIINPDADYINEFIALEASGYKGKENIAISSTIDKLNFIKDITHNPYHSIQTELYSLNANGNMIAALLGFKSGNRFFAFKTGYNEDYTKYSPGVLLMCEVTKSLLNTDPNIIADSCAIPNHPMINSLWRSRIQIASPEIAVSSFIAPSIIMMINFFKTVKSKLR
jgi:hypothetical protein